MADVQRLEDLSRSKYKVRITSDRVTIPKSSPSRTTGSFVVRQPDGTDEGIGVARFIRSKTDPGAAEAAVAVIDDWQKKGVGTLLLLRLAAAAREREITRRLRW